MPKKRPKSRRCQEIKFKEPKLRKLFRMVYTSENQDSELKKFMNGDAQDPKIQRSEKSKFNEAKDKKKKKVRSS